MPRDTKREEEAFQAVLEGTVEKAPRRVIDLAKLAAALEPANRPEADPQFKARLRSQLLAHASTSEEDAFAAMLEGDRTIVLDELVPLAKLASAMAAGSTMRAQPSPAFRFQLRNRLAAEAERAHAPARSRIAAFNERMRRSLRAVGATGLAASLLLGGGAALAASHSANPGDALYGVKRFRENAQLSISHGVPRGMKLLSFARTRLGEVKHLADHSVSQQQLYVGALNDMDSETLQGSSILIDEFRAHGTRSALQSVVGFAHDQQAGLALLINRLPSGARPAAEDSLSVAQRVATRVQLVLQGCPCPSNALEQPNVTQGSTATTQPVRCGCGQRADGGGSNGSSTSGSGSVGSSGQQQGPSPQPQPSPQPSPGIFSPIPDIPGTPIDNQIEQTIEPLVSPSPLATPTLPVSLPTASVPAVPSLPAIP